MEYIPENYGRNFATPTNGIYYSNMQQAIQPQQPVYGYNLNNQYPRYQYPDYYLDRRMNKGYNPYADPKNHYPLQYGGNGQRYAPGFMNPPQTPYHYVPGQPVYFANGQPLVYGQPQVQVQNAGYYNNNGYYSQQQYNPNYNNIIHGPTDIYAYRVRQDAELHKTEEMMMANGRRLVAMSKEGFKEEDFQANEIRLQRAAEHANDPFWKDTSDMTVQQKTRYYKSLSVKRKLYPHMQNIMLMNMPGRVPEPVPMIPENRDMLNYISRMAQFNQSLIRPDMTFGEYCTEVLPKLYGNFENIQRQVNRFHDRGTGMYNSGMYSKGISDRAMQYSDMEVQLPTSVSSVEAQLKKQKFWEAITRNSVNTKFVDTERRLEIDPGTNGDDITSNHYHKPIYRSLDTGEVVGHG